MVFQSAYSPQLGNMQTAQLRAAYPLVESIGGFGHVKTQTSRSLALSPRVSCFLQGACSGTTQVTSGAPRVAPSESGAGFCLLQ